MVRQVLSKYNAALDTYFLIMRGFTRKTINLHVELFLDVIAKNVARGVNWHIKFWLAHGCLGGIGCFVAEEEGVTGVAACLWFG
jgi:hypothetical protein